MPQAEVTWSWRPGQEVGVAAICGKVSGNLEMTELEAAAYTTDSLDKIKEACRSRGVDELWDSLQHEGYAEWTPAGGIHLMYRISDHEVPTNTKIASTADGKTLAETRGEGGYVIVAPSGGKCHPTRESWVTVAGRPGVFPTITWAQRQAIHAAIADALDESPPPAPVTPRQEIIVRTGEDMRPGDVWESKHDWDEEWFTGQGWTFSHRLGSETFWCRPGKDTRDGHSASTGYHGDKDRLYVWSTSTGLPSERPLSKFFVYSFYHYNNDMHAAAVALRAQGYGAPSTTIATLGEWNPDVRVQSDGSLPSPGGLGLTDTGNGRRMKQYYGDTFRYNTHEQCWYEWTEGTWRKDERKAIHRAAVACAERTLLEMHAWLAQVDGTDKKQVTLREKAVATATSALNIGRITAAISCFAAEEGISITSDNFNADLNLLNLPNGTLDLETLELYEHRSSDLLTLTMGAEHDKDAECPKFLQFMEDAFPDQSLRDYVQRGLGYSLLGRADQRAIFMFHGPSGTGKSVLTSVMSKVFGGYGVTAPASTFRLKNQTETLDLNRLRGARFVSTSELPEGQQLDEDLVKRFTGGDLVMSRGHYQDYREWKPTAVVWLATNYLPKVSSDDNAIWNRMKSIPMNTMFTGDGREEIAGYANILAKEANGILNWLLDGLMSYNVLGLNEPDVVTQDIMAFRTESDIVARWLRDQGDEGSLIRDSEGEVQSRTLYGAFQQYCANNQSQPLGQRRWANRLRTQGLVPIKKGGIAMWQGVRQDLAYGVLGMVRD
jgi:putative DNA primase/helicase